MTIKEIEHISGIDRANIRFYEREELLSPARLENGYRDYSEEDLQALLRIRLLRSLHISMEEIKGLQSGNISLRDALDKKLMQLEQEKEEVSWAQEICRQMQMDRVTFQSLNPRSYLERCV